MISSDVISILISITTGTLIGVVVYVVCIVTRFVFVVASRGKY